MLEDSTSREESTEAPTEPAAIFTDEEILILTRQKLLGLLPGAYGESLDLQTSIFSNLFRKLFTIAVTHMGEGAAREIWQQAVKRPRGAPKGSRRPEKDAKLLHIYDLLYDYSPDSAPSLPGEIGDISQIKCFRGQFGMSSNAVAMKVRRLLKRRQQGESFPIAPRGGALAMALMPPANK